jgi:hypothetical protein
MASNEVKRGAVSNFGNRFNFFKNKIKRLRLIDDFVNLSRKRFGRLYFCAPTGKLVGGFGLAGDYISQRPKIGNRFWAAPCLNEFLIIWFRPVLR